MSDQKHNIDLSRSRRIAFTLIAIAIPVVFFVLAELGLRLTADGEDYPLFIQNPDRPDYLLANPQVIKRFFGDPDAAPTMQIETVYFRARKPDEAIRIVVQGGSSAAGFPYGFGASLTGMLEQRLRRSFPEREIEVINTAMSAVNSYALLDFADEIIEQQPDAVLIYAGHNEYLGILGVGSAYLGGRSPAMTRGYLALRKLHLFQAMQRLFGQTGAPAGDSQAQGTMMSRVAQEKDIAYGSKLYRAGAAQFRVNLGKLLRRYEDAGVPVFVGTLVSNERAQTPFNSNLSPQTDRQEWRRRYDAAANLVESDPARARAAATTLVAYDERSADAWFLAARAAYAGQDWDNARAAFQAARDRDELRFRAPGEFNDIVATLATGNVTLVDVDAALRAQADHGILGDTLLLEHVHPTLRGYFLLAGAYYDAMIGSGLLGEPSLPADEAQAWREVPLSEVDRLFGGYKVELIKSNWPFTDTPGRPRLPPPDSVESMLAQQMYRQNIDWRTAHQRLLQHYRTEGDRENYTRVALILADAFPFRSDFLFQAGVALIEARRARQALGYLYRGAQAAPRDLNMLLALSHALALNGARDQAREVLARVLALDPGNTSATDALEQLDRLRQ